MSLEILSCRNLKKHFGENHVLRGIDLQINKGESLAIIGASGSGKSTLLRCLNFLEIPSSGEVRLRGELIGGRQNGQVLYQERDLIPIRAKIGM
ncbi:MAG: ATP-binding cassette domain-containing protein, partial [bacterium]